MHSFHFSCFPSICARNFLLSDPAPDFTTLLKPKWLLQNKKCAISLFQLALIQICISQGSFTAALRHRLLRGTYIIYSARKAKTLIVVKVANAGGARTKLVFLTVSLLLSAKVKFVTWV
jgi:hypothetical protein